MELQQGEKVGTHVEFPAYRVTDAGRVIGKNGRVLVPRVNEDGYLFVLIRDGEGLVRHAYLHHLVTEVFGPHCPDGYKWGDRLHVLVHKNGNKSDNRMENFEWFKTEVAPMQGAKLDKLQNDAVVAAATNVGRIVEACRAGRLQKDVATEFGVSQATVSAIARAAGIVRRRSLLDEQVARIHALKAEGKAYTEIAREVGCSRQVAYLIGTGRRRGLKMAAMVGCSRQEDSFPKP